MSSIIDYIEKAAVKHPEKTAIALKEKKYSFSELRNISRRLASAIPSELHNAPICVFVTRTVDIMALFLSVTYSGNFYVPIDVDMPCEKIQSIIDDSGTKVILGNNSTADLLKKINFSGTFLTLSDAKDKQCELPEIDASSPLYMVYTSGSTGKPKGVLKSHGAVVSFIEAYVHTFNFSSDDIIGNQTPFFFDASAKDIFLALKTGATIEMIPTEMFAMPTDLIDYLNDKKITFISWVPTALTIVAQLNILSFVLPEYLKKVFFVGEVMPMKHLNKWRKALPDLQYVNLYGQSELAGICCYYEVKGEFENTDTLPMGKPLSNCKIYLLDGNEIITEPEHIGEIYIVSDALATEYYNDAVKTEKNFIIKIFDGKPVRCFKTGDMASYDADGNFVFASRSDFQIKHMGHRIELGEIETVACAIPEIQRCCCLYNQDKKKIVLFCELSQGFDVTGKQIQSVLREKLSTYMLPSKVVIMDKLPLNANGKIHRTLLSENL
ncbi:MAG: amino acid adenylation domain-containing protein [Ruminococcus sp.]|nr:amino acid adenylation domain-containing protein [Candidatus Copronaster equi]